MTPDSIIVVGAGPSGLTLACELWQRGVPCRIIDGEPAATAQSRAIGVAARSLEVFDELGVAEEAVAVGNPCYGARFYSRGRPLGRMTFSSARHTKFPFMLALPQSVTESLLEKRLESLGGRVERGIRLTGLAAHGDGAALTLTGTAGVEQVVADWVIGADGAHSAVRKLSGIEFSGKVTADVFVSVDARLGDGPALGDGHYYFASGGLAVIVGLPDGMHRLTALIRTTGVADADLDGGDITALLRRTAGTDLGVRELRNAGWGINQVRINARIASTFRAGRCLLVGDAAHIFGPVGGQGMNSGVQDAHNLGWKLALVATHRAGAGLLDTYEAERLPVAVAARKHAAEQATLATMRGRVLGGTRDAVFAALCRTGLVDRRIGPSVTQLAVDYRGRMRTPAAGRGVGRRIPDTRVMVGSDLVTLLELLRGNVFTVLVLGVSDEADERVSALADRLARRFGDVVGLHVLRSDQGKIIDCDGELHDCLGVRAPTVILVRPDAHIAHRAPLDGADGPVHQLEELLA